VWGSLRWKPKREGVGELFTTLSAKVKRI
jgi:hypothetical protein